MGAEMVQNIEIPLQLRNPEFRFLLLRKGNKEPIAEMTKWQEFNFPYNDIILQNHLENGGNYGVIGGYGNLILIDSDSEEITKLTEENLPRTFTVKTGSPQPYKKHFFYICDKKLKPIRLSAEKIGDLGDVRSAGQYVVGANCLHPSGGIYKVINDIPIMKITEEKIREVFKNYIDKKASSEFKTFDIDTKIRTTPYIKSCNVPDYLIKNKLKGNTSKNWTLFRYIADILNNRMVKQEVYEKIIETQGHSPGAMRGWVIAGKNGHLEKSSCQKMREYLLKFHPEEIENICNNCNLHKKIKRREIGLNPFSQDKDYLFESFNEFTNYLKIGEEFVKKHPIYYDKAKLWWMWNEKEYKWEILDETDILNAIDGKTKTPCTKSSIKSEILESLKRIGRKNKPRTADNRWIQFKNKIIDLDTEEELDVNPKWFVTNPIPWELGSSEETPIMDKIFEEWVGKDYVKTLYEILAYCILPDYPIHRIFCLVGIGLNGKSKFLELLRKFIGIENCCATELDVLLQSRFEITRLHKKLVCQMGETNFNEISKTSILKKLSGGDLIGFEYKNKDPFEEKNYAKIIISTNNLPSTTDKTIGFYRRWMIIDFPNTFSEQKDILEDIPDLEYNNLARKCVRVLKELLGSRGFHKEGTIEERKEKYESKSNFLEQFLKTFTEEQIDSYITKAEFYRKFASWCKENRHREMSETSLGLAMKKLNVEDGTKYLSWLHEGQGGNARVWIGVKWKS